MIPIVDSSVLMNRTHSIRKNTEIFPTIFLLCKQFSTLAGKRLKLIFRESVQYLEPLMEKDECPASALKLLGLTLIVRNVSIAIKTLQIKKVVIPEKFRSAIKLVQANFRPIDVEEYDHRFAA